MERKTLKRTVIALFVLAVVFFEETHAQLWGKGTAAAGSMISAVCSGEGLHAAAKVWGSGGFAD